MPRSILAAALPVLLLASCGSPEAAAGENDAANAETTALENASPSDNGQDNGSVEPGVESVPPPDAVSHPNGFLPYGEDVPAPNASEPTADPPGPKESPPATEDDYIRNKQAGR